MRLMRTLLTASCAIAIATILLVPGVRADEYNKLTYLTFSGPVQVPGVTLPAGTYMFKLADPESGRRAIQIWSQDGSKIYATLLTVPDQMAEPKDDPVVMFKESPSGAPQAVKSWFYPGERTGMEFIYPKDQAMKIAAATNSEVLAYTEDATSTDVAAMRSAGVGRVGATGQVSSTNTASSTTTATATTASQTATATTARTETVDQTTTAQTTTAPATATTTTQSAAPATVDQTATGTATATGTTATTTAAAPSANRTESVAQAEVQAPAAAPSGRSDLSIDQDVAPQRAVGTSGQVGQARQPAGEARQLPATSSPLAALELLCAGTLAGALVVRRLRRRLVETQ